MIPAAKLANADQLATAVESVVAGGPAAGSRAIDLRVWDGIDVRLLPERGLDIGAAWFRTEHGAFGLEYGGGPPDRLRWLGEALPVIRGMLRGETPSAAGPSKRATRKVKMPRKFEASIAMTFAHAPRFSSAA